jgi:hypothetical protein
MRQKITSALLGLSFVFFVAAPITAVATPGPVSAACRERVLGFPYWYRGIVDNECNIISPAGDLSGFIWTIALNVIEIALFIVGYIALFFILYGGFMFITGGSNPAQVEKARKSILNAVIGLVISIASIGLVNLIFGVFG